MLFLFLTAQFRLAAQNCDPLNDTIPPTAVCDEFTVVAIGVDNPNDCYESNGTTQFGGITSVAATVFDDGSYDNCGGNIKLTVRRALPYSNCVLGLNTTNGQQPCGDNFPDFPSEFERAISEYDSIKFYGCEVGTTQTVILRVYQLNGDGTISMNGQTAVFNECLVSVEVTDKIKPTCTAPANTTVTCVYFDPSLWAYGNPAVVENACLDTIIKTVDYAQFDTVCNKGTLTRTFQVVDCSGNSNTCSQKIVVNYEQDYYVRFPSDVIVTAPNGSDYGEPVFFREDCELLGVSFTDEIFGAVPDADLKIERTWMIVNWCTFDSQLPLITVPNPNPNATPNHPSNLPGPTISVDTAAVPWKPTIVKIDPADPAPTNYSVFYDPNANGYKYTQIIKIFDAPEAIVTGNVYLDTLDNCNYDSGEPLLAGWTVKATGLVSGEEREGLTNSSGAYTLLLPSVDTMAEVTLSAPFNFGQNCPSIYTIATESGETSVQDIAVHLETVCPLLSVDLTTPRLRRCFPNTYTVQACNLGTETVENVYVEVALDDFMTFTNSSIPGTLLSNNTYSFDLGSMNAGVCTTFQVNFVLECAALPGATHCTEAHIYPNTLCDTTALWSGADIEVTGYCDGDSVRLTINNVGTGDMAEALEFVVVEDVIMYMNGTFQLDNGVSKSIALPANGSTWRLEADEEIHHPWGGVEAKALEGCGGINIPGLVTQFSLNTPEPFETTDCLENIGSFDPNDKQAFPRGFGNQHLIEANTDLEYMIRFQNTGTDTAFTVMVLDTLSTHLVATSVRPGASSHPYDFAVLDGNVLRFRFDHILLPDSNINEPASHGFIKFRASQQPDNPNGTLIENRAAIYFDFNEPVLTNTTFHTIGDHFIMVQTDDPAGATPIRVYPNPSASVAIFEMPAHTDRAVFQLTDRLGQSQRSDIFSGRQYRFERGVLPAGVYFYKITVNKQAVYSGKVLLR